MLQSGKYFDIFGQGAQAILSNLPVSRYLLRFLEVTRRGRTGAAATKKSLYVCAFFMFSLLSSLKSGD
jgi:pyrrolidone-carboxylate peptidase